MLADQYLPWWQTLGRKIDGTGWEREGQCKYLAREFKSRDNHSRTATAEATAATGRWEVPCPKPRLQPVRCRKRGRRGRAATSRRALAGHGMRRGASSLTVDHDTSASTTASTFLASSLWSLAPHSDLRPRAQPAIFGLWNMDHDF